MPDSGTIIKEQLAYLLTALFFMSCARYSMFRSILFAHYTSVTIFFTQCYLYPGFLKCKIRWRPAYNSNSRL